MLWQPKQLWHIEQLWQYEHLWQPEQPWQHEQLWQAQQLIQSFLHQRSSIPDDSQPRAVENFATALKSTKLLFKVRNGNAHTHTYVANNPPTVQPRDHVAVNPPPPCGSSAKLLQLWFKTRPVRPARVHIKTYHGILYYTVGIEEEADRRESKSRRCWLGDRVDSMPCRTIEI